MFMRGESFRRKGQIAAAKKKDNVNRKNNGPDAARGNLIDTNIDVVNEARIKKMKNELRLFIVSFGIDIAHSFGIDQKIVSASLLT